MTSPSLAEYLDAALQENGDGSLNTGLTVLTNADGTPVQSIINQDGFAGTAFVTPENQVIVAFKGTDIKDLFSNPLFVVPQILADYQIYLGQNPAAYADAITFTDAALAASADSVPAGNLFVDGHSLGGAEAAYVATQTGFAGTTFGAPGLAPGDIPPDTASGLANYVEYGDPVGNYSGNPNYEGNFLYEDGISRFGDATYIGGASSRLVLQIAGSLYGQSDSATAASLLLFAEAAIEHHPLTDYASDLGFDVPSGPTYTAAQVLGALDQALGQTVDLGATDGTSPVSFNAGLRFLDRSTAVLTGSVSDPGAVANLEVYATSQAAGGLVDLGAATVRANGTWRLAESTGTDTLSGIFAVKTDTDGSVTAGFAPYSFSAGQPGPYAATQTTTDADGTVTDQAFYNRRGLLDHRTSFSANADGGYTLTSSGGRAFAQTPYFAFADRYDATNTQVEEDVFYKDGHQTVQGLVPGQTLNSISEDTFYPTGGNNTFVFTPGFGTDVITSFQARGAQHDTIDLSATRFTDNLQLLARIGQNQAGDAVIRLDPHDTITVEGVGRQALVSHPKDFVLHA